MQAIRRRFDRIHANQNVNIRQNDIFVEDCTERVILDFDNNIPVIVHSPANDASCTPILTYGEELAQISSFERPEVLREPEELNVHLDECSTTLATYEARAPMFTLSAKLVGVAVLLCALLGFSLISYSPLHAHSGQKLIQTASSRANDLSPENLGAAIEFVESTSVGSANDAVEGYKLFLRTWHERIDAGVERVAISLDDAQFPRTAASAHAAYVSQKLNGGDVEAAKRYAQSLDRAIFKGQGDYLRWIGASIAKADGQVDAAAAGFAKLSRGRLASFAFMELAQLSLEHTNSAATALFLQEALSPSTKELPIFARCALEILSPGSGAEISAYGKLSQPYRDYCAIADMRQQLDRLAVCENCDVARVEALSANNSHRLNLAIRLALSRGQIEQASRFYHQFEHGSVNEIELTALENLIVDEALRTGNLGALHHLYHELDSGDDFVMILRYIDMRRYFPNETNLYTQGAWPSYFWRNTAALPKVEPTQPYLLALHRAYQSANYGYMAKALSQTREIAARYPQSTEAFMMQIRFLAAWGKEAQAADILLARAQHDTMQAPLLALAALMQARSQNFAAWLYPVQHLRFNDLALRIAQCESKFWKSAKSANACVKQLSLEAKEQRTLAVMDAFLNPVSDPEKQWANLERANISALSFTGLHAARAKAAVAAKMHKEAVRAFSDSILLAPADVEAPKALANYYMTCYKSYEGTKKLESLIRALPQHSESLELLAACHVAAARLYKPESANAAALKHLLRAKSLVGNDEFILKGLIKYYKAKEKPYFVKKYTDLLQKQNDDENATNEI
ncbi:MAG: hypothetical protein ACOX8U_02205 [Bradymonadia bacterium]|jgi:hypothetical protein